MVHILLLSIHLSIVLNVFLVGLCNCYILLVISYYFFYVYG